jgi:hypothetical protein
MVAAIPLRLAAAPAHLLLFVPRLRAKMSRFVDQAAELDAAAMFLPWPND